MPTSSWSGDAAGPIAPAAFRVRYLGCATFESRRTPAGVSALQRPLLRLYAGAIRQKCPPQPPLAQRLDVLEYGLVVAESPGDETKNLVVTRVLTPLCNAGPWAALRFRARALPRRGALGAAFVPLACSEIDPKDYVRLPAKHRFLVGVGGHPPLFAVALRRVSSPRRFEVHAFACASAAQALALAAAVGEARKRSEGPSPLATVWRPPRGSSSTSGSTETAFAGHRFRQRGFPSSFAGSCEEDRGTTDEQYYASVDPDHRRAQNSHADLRNDVSRSDEEVDEVGSLCWRPLPTDTAPRTEDPSRRDAATMTESRTVEVLARSIDLSSEEEEEDEDEDRPVGDASGTQPSSSTNPVRHYYYFGLDAWDEKQRATQKDKTANADCSFAEAANKPMVENRKPHRGAIIRGNGTERVTIRVPFPPPPSSALSSASSVSSRSTVLRGVRGFRSDGHVRDWSTIDRCSVDRSPAFDDKSRCPKTIRWSSDEGQLRQGTDKSAAPPFWSLRRLVGFRTFAEAKRRTGKFLSSVRSRLVGPKKSPEDSEDSAYDTSEVCLSPSGRRVTAKGARRQQSWSFHDLRVRGRPSPPRLRRGRPPSLTSSSSSPPPTLPTTRSRGGVVRKGRNRRRASQRALVRDHRGGTSTTSSDSGVEGAGATPSDDISGSSAPRPKPSTQKGANYELRRNASFQRWSNTNLQDELGYIP